MTIAKNRLMTLEEYLIYDDGTDTRYELEHGTLIEMAPENPLNNTIVLFLISRFLMTGTPHYCLATGHAIQVISDQASTRIPDLTVHSPASASAILQDRKLLRLEAPAPVLVVETVSSSNTDKVSRDRDYIFKRAEYAHRGIPEYWIIDPANSCVIILSLTESQDTESQYTEHKYTGEQQIVSPSFPTMSLTARQILTAGMDARDKDAEDKGPDM